MQFAKSFFNWAIPGLFFLIFFRFNTVDSIKVGNIKFADDWIRTSLLLEATTLPSEPQPPSQVCMRERGRT